MKILIVEDDDVTRDYIARGLEAAGHAAALADNGIEGLAMALRGEYDAIVWQAPAQPLGKSLILEAAHASDCYANRGVRLWTLLAPFAGTGNKIDAFLANRPK